MDTLAAIAEVIGLVVALVLILIATYYTTRFIAKQTGDRFSSKNIKVIETYRIAPNKYIQIVEVAGRFLCIAVTKDNIEMLTELNPEDVEVMSAAPSEGAPLSFIEVLKNIKKNK
ncbi:MAG: flagellar biosynthetic protein FliO [Lachnospiraceae bacterium]|jgi:flagellar protein FliO/FliZ|nr:flagellar biosynthetic protein FliO [Lachnospiraceae bacterium]